MRLCQSPEDELLEENHGKLSLRFNGEVSLEMLYIEGKWKISGLLSKTTGLFSCDFGRIQIEKRMKNDVCTAEKIYICTRCIR